MKTLKNKYGQNKMDLLKFYSVCNLKITLSLLLCLDRKNKIDLFYKLKSIYA